MRGVFPLRNGRKPTRNTSCRTAGDLYQPGATAASAPPDKPAMPEQARRVAGLAHTASICRPRGLLQKSVQCGPSRRRNHTNALHVSGQGIAHRRSEKAFAHGMPATDCVRRLTLLSVFAALQRAMRGRACGSSYPSEAQTLASKTTDRPIVRSPGCVGPVASLFRFRVATRAFRVCIADLASNRSLILALDLNKSRTCTSCARTGPRRNAGGLF